MLTDKYTRWFISYRLDRRIGVLLDKRIVKYCSVITDVTPAQWVREHTVDHHIQYAEKISVSLASELTHGGAGVPAEYFCIEGDEEVT